MTGVVRLGTRGSLLALWQTEHVRALLEQAEPGLRFETVIMSTTGDRIIDTPLPAIGGKGLFTAELEEALRDGSIDLAVHSLKDLPTEVPGGLVVGAVLERADPADALVSREGLHLATLPAGATIGTSSTRRKAQLLAHRPDLDVIDLRGNADTRLRKARDPDGPYDAIVMAHAALVRLGEAAAVTELLSDEIMLPAPGQGALAVECRDEEETINLLRRVSHLATEVEIRAERGFLAALGGGCAVPVAARARMGADGRLRVRGRVSAPDGTEQVDVAGETLVGSGADAPTLAEQAGRTLAAAALEKGAGELLSGALPRDGDIEA